MALGTQNVDDTFPIVFGACPKRDRVCIAKYDSFSTKGGNREKSSSQKALKVISIILIILAIISIIGSFMMALGGGVVGGAAAGAADPDAFMAGSVLMIGGIILALGSVFDLIVGFLGLRGANNPSKIGIFYILAIIDVVVSLAIVIYSLFGGSFEIYTIIGEVISLAFPVACVVLAYNIKKENNL